jgi:hypothetical protein
MQMATYAILFWSLVQSLFVLLRLAHTRGVPLVFMRPSKSSGAIDAGK